MSETILEEASRITSGERQRDYGHPLDNLGQIAAFWNAYLGDRLKTPLTFRDVAWLNILQKASRDSYLPKRDNLVDCAGYAHIAQVAEEEMLRRWALDNPGHGPSDPQEHAKWLEQQTPKQLEQSSSEGSIEEVIDGCTYPRGIGLWEEGRTIRRNGKIVHQGLFNGNWYDRP